MGWRVMRFGTVLRSQSKTISGFAENTRKGLERDRTNEAGLIKPASRHRSNVVRIIVYSSATLQDPASNAVKTKLDVISLP